MSDLSVLMVCITTLLVFGGVLAFGNKFLTTAKIREQKLKEEIKAHVLQELQDIKKFREDIQSDINTLAENHLKLVENQKALVTSIQMNSPTGRSSILQGFREAQKGQK